MQASSHTLSFVAKVRGGLGLEIDPAPIVGCKTTQIDSRLPVNGLCKTWGDGNNADGKEFRKPAVPEAPSQKRLRLLQARFSRGHKNPAAEKADVPAHNTS